MKSPAMSVRSLLLLVAAGLISAWAQAPVWSQEITPNRISVLGTAEVTAPADRAELNFLVEGFGSDLRKAVAGAMERESEVGAKLGEFGLAKSAVATAKFSVGENWLGRAFLSSKKDFRAAIGVTVTLDSLELLQPLLFLLSESGVEMLSDIIFTARQDSALKAVAREVAMQKAQEKARQMASLLGADLGRVVAVEELTPLERREALYRRTGYPSPFNALVPQNLSGMTSVREDGGAILLPGTVAVNASVRVMFDFTYGAVSSGSSVANPK
jgi:uncharacterized protein YggE